MAKPIRLTQEEFNRLCSIEHYAREISEFLSNDPKPIDWPAHKKETLDGDLRYSRALYCLIAMQSHLDNGYKGET